MKLTEQSARFTVVRTAFHRGGTVSFHKSLDAAERAARRECVPGCGCGCCHVKPVTPDALREMQARYGIWYDDTRLYADLPDYTGNNGPYDSCK